MKKLLFFLIMTICMVSVSYAQSSLTATNTSGTSKTSTYTNADTGYLKIDLGGQTNNYNHGVFVLKGTKTSGTVGGTVVLFGSNENTTDYTRWFQVYAKDSVSSQSLTNGNTTLKWELIPSSNSSVATPFRYYMLRIYTTGTQVSTNTATFFGRKVPN